MAITGNKGDVNFLSNAVYYLPVPLTDDEILIIISNKKEYAVGVEQADDIALSYNSKLDFCPLFSETSEDIYMVAENSTTSNEQYIFCTN